MKRILLPAVSVIILSSGMFLTCSEPVSAAYGDPCQSPLGLSGTCQLSCSSSSPLGNATGCASGEVCCTTAATVTGETNPGGSTATSGTSLGGSTTTASTTTGSDSGTLTCGDGYEKMAGVCVPTSSKVGLSDREPGQVVVSVMNWLMAILGILAILMIVVAGMLYLTAAGDEKKTETAKNIIMYVVIGVAVALTAYTIVYTVGQLVTGGGETADQARYY